MSQQRISNVRLIVEALMLMGVFYGGWLLQGTVDRVSEMAEDMAVIKFWVEEQRGEHGPLIKLESIQNRVSDLEADVKAIEVRDGTRTRNR